MPGDVIAQLTDMATRLVGNWQYFVDGCLGGLFLEIAVVGGVSRVNRAHISHKFGAVVYTIACIIGGGLYASRFLAASSDYAAMVGGFTFPITVGSIGGKLPDVPAKAETGRRRERSEKARNSLRQRVDNG
jgi:hypothetical protein